MPESGHRRASGAATTDRLRDDIDRGRTGDKVDFSDPAAAPLGTDDEAAGTPPAPADVAAARRREVRHAGRDRPARSSGNMRLILALAVIVLVALGLWLMVA